MNNMCKNYPHVTQLLERKVYSRRKRMKGMSQYALADKSGVTRNCIQQIEAHLRVPNPSTIYDIIYVLGFNEEERNAFAIEYMEAYYKDKAFQRAREGILDDTV